MVYVFYKHHICFFLSVLKKTNTLHLYSMCGGIKTLAQREEQVATRLPRLQKSHTHEQNTSSKTHPNSCNCLVHDSRVSYFFRLVRIECNQTVAWQDVKFKNQNRRQKVLNRGFKFTQGDLKFWKLDKIFTDLQHFIFKFGRAELTNGHRSDWTGLNFAYAVIIEIRMKK